MIQVKRADRYAVVTLQRPDARNALTGAMIAELHTALLELDDDPAIRCVVLTGADPAFCAGLDLRDLTAVYQQAMQRVSSRPTRGLVPRTRTPLIGAINGPAVTGGLELAMSCDFLIASDRATFADTHARVGVLPGGGMSIRLPQLIGIDRARRMSLTGNFIDAHTAYDWGLVTEVVAHDQLLPRAIAVARDVADADPQVMTALRALYDQLGHRGDPEDYLDEARQSRQWMATRSAPDHHDDVITRGRSQQPPAP